MALYQWKPCVTNQEDDFPWDTSINSCNPYTPCIPYNLCIPCNSCISCCSSICIPYINQLQERILITDSSTTPVNCNALSNGSQCSTNPSLAGAFGIAYNPVTNQYGITSSSSTSGNLNIFTQNNCSKTTFPSPGIVYGIIFNPNYLTDFLPYPPSLDYSYFLFLSYDPSSFGNSISVYTSTNTIQSIFVTGNKTSMNFTGLTIGGVGLYVADNFSNNIYVYNPITSGGLLQSSTPGPGGSVQSNPLNLASIDNHSGSLTYSSSNVVYNVAFIKGYLYVAANGGIGTGIIDVLSPDGGFIGRFADHVAFPGSLNVPYSMILLDNISNCKPGVNYLLVSNTGDGSISVFTFPNIYIPSKTNILGTYVGKLTTTNGSGNAQIPVCINGLVGLTNVQTANPNLLFAFASQPVYGSPSTTGGAVGNFLIKNSGK
jgi:hypothetical protein